MRYWVCAECGDRYGLPDRDEFSDGPGFPCVDCGTEDWEEVESL